MKKISIIFLSFIILIITGCQKDLPEPESILTDRKVVKAVNLPVSNFTNETESFDVKYHVRGHDVYIECKLDGITFRTNSNVKQGKVILTIDRIKKEEFSNAAFIIKGLSSGEHHLKLEVVKPNNHSYNLTKEMIIKIP